MPELPPLSVAFVESHPEQAARVLDVLPVVESAAFLASAPARLAAGVAKHMTPQYAARCVEAMEERAAGGLVAALGPQAAAALLQHLPADLQSRALTRLPAGSAMAVRLLIGHAQDTAGAWMDPLPLALPADTTAAEALAALRVHDGEPGDALFVIAAGRRVLGVVGGAVLLRAEPTVPLSRVMRHPAPCVSSLTPLAAVRSHPGWLQVPALAVIEGQERLVGALRRAVVEAALTQCGSTAGQPRDVVSGLGGACWEVFVSLAQLAVSFTPAIPPVARRRENAHEY